ncbi:MAG: hypothetical protein J7J52_01805 [Deltaproteobacteria bacterium]|nr:hypothetical protein [Deltaproteobacteria bacterium]
MLKKSGCIFISADGQDVLNPAMPVYKPKISGNYSPSKLKTTKKGLPAKTANNTYTGAKAREDQKYWRDLFGNKDNTYGQD